jgi:hypothetical protein
VTIYRSKIAAAFVRDGLWLPFPGRREIVAVPVHDQETGTSGQWSARDALEVARALGGALPTFDDVTALDRIGFRIDPVTLPDAKLRRDDPRLEGETSKAYEIRIRRNMASLEWLRWHDALCWRALAGWDRTKPVANFGKLWIGPTPKGAGKIRGWRDRNGTWIQQGLRPQHNDAHLDYATKVVVVRERPVMVAA